MDTPFLGALRPAPRTIPFTRPVVAALLVILVAASSMLGSGGPADAAPVSTASQTKSYPAMAPAHYEDRVQHWVNVQRKHHGLRALRFARCTDGTAERWSSHLAEKDLFYHQSMEDLLTRCDARYAGETLARGSVAPRRLVRMWMHSDGHRRVLMSSKARRIGIGASPDTQGRWVVAANFMRL
jgi:uncharacterized protein YkwD